VPGGKIREKSRGRASKETTRR